MTRLEIETKFREENPEFTANVITAATLHSWCLAANKEICCKARLIVDTATITAVEDQANYDLTAISKFYDIDEIPGGGVSRVDDDGNEKRLDKTSKSKLDSEISSWRTADSSTPRQYFRRGKYMYVHPAPDDSIVEFNLDVILRPDDFNDDNIEPYNQLAYLSPFHDAILFYLAWRAKAKVGKGEEAATAMSVYGAYLQWMRKEIGGGKYGSIEFRPSGLPSSGFQR